MTEDLEALEEVSSLFEREYARDGRTQHCLKHPISKRHRPRIKSMLAGYQSHKKRRRNVVKPTVAKIPLTNGSAT